MHGSFDSGAVRSMSSSTSKYASIREALKPWERAHGNGYGGLSSIGVKSYDGAIGGFIIVCVATSARRRDLYSSKDQYPTILNRLFI